MKSGVSTNLKKHRGRVQLFVNIATMMVAIFLGIGFTYAYFTARSTDNGNIEFANVSISFVDNNEMFTSTLFADMPVNSKIQPGQTISINNIYAKNTGEYDVYAIYELTLDITKVGQTISSYTKTYYYNLAGTPLTGDSTNTTDEATLLKQNNKLATNLSLKIPYELDNSYKQASAKLNLNIYAIQSLLKEDTTQKDTVTACQLILKNKTQPDIETLKIYLDGKLKAACLPTSKKVKDISVDGITTDNSPGWFYDADCTEFAYDEDTITADTILYTKTATLDKLNITTNTDGTATIAQSANIATGEVVIPRTHSTSGTTYTITSIGKYAFSNGYMASRVELQKITMPQTIRTIGLEAFAVTNISSISLPEGLTYIDYKVFENTYLTKLKLPRSLTSTGGDMAKYCSRLKEVELPDTFISLGSKISGHNGYDFYNCNILEKINLPASLVFIGPSMFEYCAKLKKIVIPSSVVTIGENAFNRCNSLSIYCEVSSKPDGWADTWNAANRPVTWGYTGTSTTSQMSADLQTTPAILPSKQRWSVSFQ